MRNNKKRLVYADFECTTEANYKIEGETRVYLWGAILDGKEHHGLTLNSFLEWLPKCCRIYFHNLRYDGEFILNHLLKNNIKYSILEKMNNIYSLKIGHQEFIDTTNFFPNTTLKELAIQFNTTQPKGDIDYDMYRPLDFIVPENEIGYVLNDARILSEVMPIFYNILGDQIKDFLESIGVIKSKTLAKLEKFLTISGIAFSVFKESCNFEQLFPKPSPQEDLALRPAYKGGYVYCKKGEYKWVLSVDINSSYTNSYGHKPLPYGRGVYYDGDKRSQHDFNIITIRCRYDLKKGFPPIIGGGIGMYGGTEYSTTSNGNFEEHTICCVDLRNWIKHYDIEYQVLYGYGFRSIKGVFTKYAEFFYNLKQTKKGVEKMVAKLMNNGPYGKSAMNGLNDTHEFYLDEIEGVKKRIVGRTLNEKQFQYIPLAIYVTAYSRERLYEGINTVGLDDTYYCDTDSIKMNDLKEVNILHLMDNNKVGYFKNEGISEYAKFYAPKKYITWNTDLDHKIKVTCAGFGKDVTAYELNNKKTITYTEAMDTIKKFDKDFTVEVLQFKKVKGGKCPIKLLKSFK